MGWIITLGLCDLFVLLLGAAILAGACIVVAKSRRPVVIASYSMFVPLPSLAACCGLLSGLINSFAAIAAGAALPSQTELFAGLTASFRMMRIGLMPPLLTYLVIAVGLSWRLRQVASKATIMQ